MILNTATSFAQRVLTLSHRRFHSENKIRIRNILDKNDFPHDVITSVIDRAIQRRSNAYHSQRSYPFINDTTVNEPSVERTGESTPPKAYASLRYVPRMTDVLTHRLHELLPDVRIAHKPANQLRTSFTNMKQKLPSGKKSCVVYRIDCMDCEKCYVGETTVRLEDRLGQHEKDESMSQIKESTALVGHVRETGHSSNLENAKILQHESLKSKLKIQEVNQIIAHGNQACNYKSDSSYVSPAYYNLVLSAVGRNRFGSQNQHHSSFSDSSNFLSSTRVI